MKKEYVVPVATEEVFSTNSYVAACTWQITSSSGNNRMQCANPKHGHFMNGKYFTSVWVAATNSTCQIIVTQDGIGKTEVIGGQNARPAYGATVYGENGERYTCTDQYTKGKGKDAVTYYVPDFVNSSTNGGACYGTYVNTGTYSEIMDKVFS